MPSSTSIVLEIQKVYLSDRGLIDLDHLVLNIGAGLTCTYFLVDAFQEIGFF
jgi:hypothetical protein